MSEMLDNYIYFAEVDSMSDLYNASILKVVNIL